MNPVKPVKKVKKRVNLKGIKFSSNAIRLNLWELGLAALIVVVGVLFIGPMAWRHLESCEYGSNFRLAEKFRDDYWAYGKWSEKAIEKHPVVFLGDSVVWGMYVDSKNTLPAKMNAILGEERIANLAINGLHSVALKGLLENYSAPIKGKTVILHFNPLWINGVDNDLSGRKQPQVNHPRLLPQFVGKPSTYDADLTARMDAEKERFIPFFSLLNHVRMAFFNNADIRQWLVDNPYSNPVSGIFAKLDLTERKKINDDENWEEKGITKQSWNWVNLNSSLQWKALTEIVELLQRNDNKVLVMAGPINPHMLNADSLAKYRSLQASIKSALDARKVPCYIVPDLPTEVYADASHPLDKGYQMIAEGLLSSGLVPGLPAGGDRKQVANK